MGCIGYIVDEVTKLKNRKVLKEFKTGNDMVKMYFQLKNIKRSLW